MKRIGIGLLLAALLGTLVWATLPGLRASSPQALVEGLSGSDGVNCFDQLRQNEDEATTAAIVEGTKHASARVRNQCARLIGQRQDVTLASVLAPMLSDRDPAVRNQAARSMMPLLDDDELVELLRTPELSPASQMVMVGALLRDPTAITNQKLLDWLLDRSHSPEVRAGSYQALRNHHSPCFGERKQEKEQLPAVLAARQRIRKQAHEDAVDANCQEEVRCTALPLYAALTGPAAYEEMLGFLKAKEPALQEASLVALAATQDQRAWPLFCGLAVDVQQTPRIQARALAGIRHLARNLNKEKEAFPIFCRVAENARQPVEVRAAALTSLRPYRFELEALRIANLALVDKNPVMRQKAAYCLSGLGDWNAPLDSPLWLEPSLAKVRLALAVETDAEAQCAMRNAISSLETRISNRGK